MPERDPRAVAKTTAAAVYEGAHAPWEGLRYMSRHPALWRYAAIPIVLNLLITLFLFAALALGLVRLVVFLHPKLPPGSVGFLIELVCVAVTLVLSLGIAAAIWLLLGGVFCGYFYGLLAREVELSLGTPASDLREVGLWHEIVDAFSDFGILIAVNIGFLSMHFVPVVGSFAGTCGAILFDCYVFGNDYLDFPLSLRSMRRCEKRQFARRYLAHTVGLGAVVLLCSLVPILGAVVLAAAATGAVLLYHRLEGAAHAALPPQIVVAEPHGTGRWLSLRRRLLVGGAAVVGAMAAAILSGGAGYYLLRGLASDVGGSADAPAVLGMTVHFALGLITIVGAAAGAVMGSLGGLLALVSKGSNVVPPDEFY